MAHNLFRLRPVLVRDFDACDRIIATAFADDMMPFMFPNGRNERDRAHGYPLFVKHLNDPQDVHRYMAVIDITAKPDRADLAHLSSTERTEAEKEGRIAGVAYWNFHRKSRTQEELAAEGKAAEAEGTSPSANVAFIEAFFGQLLKAKRDILGGKPHVLLHILGTDPNYHRKGIGAMHLRWGLDEADRLGIPVYLEASLIGEPLYERWGFEPIRRLGMGDVKFMGMPSPDPMLMLRPAKGL